MKELAVMKPSVAIGEPEPETFKLSFDEKNFAPVSQFAKRPD